MHLPNFDQIEGYIAAVGYPALFGLLFACGFGLPVPEDVPLIVAGALIAKGSMSWLWAGIFAWCGIIGGDICLYWISRKVGPRVTQLPLLRGHITQDRLDRVHKMFDKYGVGVVAVGRLFAGIRGAMVICAGTIRFNFLTFIIADSLAAIVSGGLWMWLGHWLGSNLTAEKVEHYKFRIIAGMIVLAIGFLIWVLWKRRNKDRVIAHDETVIKTVSQIPRMVTDKIKPKPGLPRAGDAKPGEQDPPQPKSGDAPAEASCTTSTQDPDRS
jgi:membrane protein DedA with SNARE-associated domain